MCNISRSGLLFTTPRAHALNSRIELTFALPAVIRDEAPGAVRCQGEVVRSTPFSRERAIAIKILDYQFMRTEALPIPHAEVAKRGC